MDPSEVRSLVEELLRPDGPSALVLTEELEPVDGRKGVFFPPTYSPPREKAQEGPIYAAADLGDGTKAYIVDSVESQANRIEELFKRDPYCGLIPQVKIKIKKTSGGEFEIPLLDASHRIADALVRCSKLADEVGSAFEEFRKGNSLPIARISPLSILLGFWDSRGTGAKAPRLLRSEIIAWRGRELVRKAQFSPGLLKQFRPEEEWRVYLELEPFKKVFEEEFEQDNGKFSKWLSETGFSSVPAQELLGGVVLEEGGKIERSCVLHLVGIRALSGKDEGESQLLRKYILALGMVAFTAPQDYNLRQGCLLVKKSVRCRKVYRDGREEELSLEHEKVLEFAKKVAKDFMERFRISKDPVEVEFREEKLREVVEEQKKKSERKKKSADET